MKAVILDSPPPDIRTEWRRLNDAISDMQQISRVASSHPHLIAIQVNEGGIVFNFSGLIDALAAKGVL